MREGVAEGERRFKDGPGWRRNLGELKGDGCRRHDEEGTRPAERGERRQKKGRNEAGKERKNRQGRDRRENHRIHFSRIANLKGSPSVCLCWGDYYVRICGGREHTSIQRRPPGDHDKSEYSGRKIKPPYYPTMSGILGCVLLLFAFFAVWCLFVLGGMLGFAWVMLFLFVLGLWRSVCLGL